MWALYRGFPQDFKLTHCVSALICELSNSGGLDLAIRLPHLHLTSNLYTYTFKINITNSSQTSGYASG